MSNAANQNGSGLEQQVRKEKDERKDRRRHCSPRGSVVPRILSTLLPPPPPRFRSPFGFSRSPGRVPDPRIFPPRDFPPTRTPVLVEERSKGNFLYPIEERRGKRGCEREREIDREHHGPSLLVGQLVTYATYNGGKRFRERHASCRDALSRSPRLFPSRTLPSTRAYSRDRIARGRGEDPRASRIFTESDRDDSSSGRMMIMTLSARMPRGCYSR